MPWFAIVAIVAIVIWGGITVLSMLTGKPLPWSDAADSGELEKLRKRVEALESGAVQGAGAQTQAPGLEERLGRIERRLDKRELRDAQHDDWERRAKELELEQKSGTSNGEDDRPDRS